MNKALTLSAARAAVDLQQSALVAAIFPQSPVSAHLGDEKPSDMDARGLKIYQNNLLLTAQQALAISFPTVVQLVGADVFNYASKLLLIQSPPSQGDWGLWGEGLPAVLTDLAALAQYPFAADIARLDWMRHHSMRAQNNQVDPQSLQLLASVELDALYIDYAASIFTMHSVFPIIEFWQASQPGTEAGNNSEQLMAQALEKLQQKNFQQRILVYRPHYRAEIRELNTAEQQWLEHTINGVSIGHTLDKIEDTDFDFTQWLGLALQHNIISRLRQ